MLEIRFCCNFIAGITWEEGGGVKIGGAGKPGGIRELENGGNKGMGENLELRELLDCSTRGWGNQGIGRLGNGGLGSERTALLHTRRGWGGGG